LSIDSNEDLKNLAYGEWAKRITVTRGLAMNLTYELKLKAIVAVRCCAEAPLIVGTEKESP